MELYTSAKPLPKVQHPEPKEAAPKGMVRASTYQRRQFQAQFKKESAR